MISLEDQIKVVRVSLVADGYCSNCFIGCLREAIIQWPDADWQKAIDVVRKETQDDYMFENAIVSELIR